ncbi:hypothetical protein KC360_g6419 [Hortaea werneckii]|nr:hypothetical protein KC325_g6293 [Hortaea werneckii]KAI6989758.1 hypothetical protein KC359_g7033 [Hortaea werneckii]KAI7143375.1 hypothetical protein KC344_g6333 [Hortaea werneckii]KAI7170973.1 hypothetical protein KC360_g6419 [Hortaea werneckii]
MQLLLDLFLMALVVCNTAVAQKIISQSAEATGETSSLRIFERPPVPISSGSTYTSHPITTETYFWNGTGTAEMPVPGFATYGNTTFNSVCSSTDKACYSTCSALAHSCSAERSRWLSSSSSFVRSAGNASRSMSYTTSTYQRPPETMTTYNVTYLITKITDTIPNGNVANAGTTSFTTANAACETSSCRPEDRSTLTTDYFWKSSTQWWTITHSQGYAVDGTYSIYTTSTPDPVLHTYSSWVYPVNYTVPEPECQLSTSTQCSFSKDCKKCTISGGTVQLLYFPVSRTSASPSGPNTGSGKVAVETNASWNRSTPTTTLGPTAPITKGNEGPETAVYEDTTLTSPSVYISFHTAYANNECGSQVGQRYPGAILALDQTDLSSVYGLYGTVYSTISDPLFPVAVTTPYLRAGPFDLADLNWPIPPEVYRNQLRFVMGRDTYSVVFDDYSPILAVPPQIRDMDPAWADCELDWEGLYDPPKALKPASTVAGVTTPVGGDSKQTEAASPSSQPDAPASRTTDPAAAKQTSELAFGAADPSNPIQSGGAAEQTSDPLDPTQSADEAEQTSDPHESVNQPEIFSEDAAKPVPTSPGPDKPASGTEGFEAAKQTSELAFGASNPPSRTKSAGNVEQTFDPQDPADQVPRPSTVQSGQSSSISGETHAEQPQGDAPVQDPAGNSKSGQSAEAPGSPWVNGHSQVSNTEAPSTLIGPGGDPAGSSSAPSVDATPSTAPPVSGTSVESGGSTQIWDESSDEETTSAQQPSQASGNSLSSSVTVLSVSSKGLTASNVGKTMLMGASEKARGHQDPIATAINFGLEDGDEGSGDEASGEAKTADVSSWGTSGYTGDSSVLGAHYTNDPHTNIPDSQTVAPSISLGHSAGQTQQLAADQEMTVSLMSGQHLTSATGALSRPRTEAIQASLTTGLPVIETESSEKSGTVATVTIDGKPYTATKSGSDVVIVDQQTISAGGSGLAIPHATLTVADNGELQMIWTKAPAQSDSDRQPRVSGSRSVKLSFPSTTLTAIERLGASKHELIVDGETLSAGGTAMNIEGNTVSAVEGGVVVGSAGRSITKSLYSVSTTSTGASATTSMDSRESHRQTTDLIPSSSRSSLLASSSEGVRSQPSTWWIQLAVSAMILLLFI